MATYLLTWNPNRWDWTKEEIQEDRAQLDELGPEKFQQVRRSKQGRGYRWSIGTNFRRIQLGDRLFLIRLGKEPRGIFASGQAASYPYEASHWDEEEDQIAWYVDIYWDTLLNPNDAGLILSRDELEFISTEQRWSPIASGEEIKEDAATKLEDEWRRFSESERGDDW